MLELLQWPAMVVTLIASWMVASKTRGRRLVGFWAFLLSNVLWIAWGVPTHAYALVALQAFLIVTNVRGILKARAPVREDGALGTKAAHRLDSPMETSDV
jgi:hypothetical protein